MATFMKSTTTALSKNVFVFFASLFLALTLSSCIPRHEFHRDKLSYPVSSPEDFTREIDRMEKLARFHPDKSVRAEAHLRLAMLYLHDENPGLDYSRALEELKKYKSLSSNGDNKNEIRGLLALLQKFERVMEQNKEKERAIQALTREKRILIRENQQIKETIDELKDMDVRIEEKRREIK